MGGGGVDRHCHPESIGGPLKSHDQVPTSTLVVLERGLEMNSDKGDVEMVVGEGLVWEGDGMRLWYFCSVVGGRPPFTARKRGLK